MFDILWKVIAPIFALIGLGYVVQKRVGFDLKTLTRLNFWVFVPAFLFVHIYESQLSGAQLGKIVLHFCVFFSLLWIVTWTIATLFGFQDRLKRALTATVLFYNSGNYGIPVAQLAFPGVALPLQVQAAMVMMQNIANFTLGLALVAGGRGGRKRDTLREIFKLPMIYVLVVAWAMRFFHIPVPGPIETSLHWLERGLVPVAVVTLGAQMASLKAPPFSRALAVSLGMRLLFAPVLGFATVWMLGIRGELAQALVISTAFPTAVNAALLALEFDNEPEFAAAAVFYSTLLSSVTVSVVIFAAQKWMG
ncbi:MAG: AEC family transporter [Armatimonadetes bacterium]|nr:AEC family transporter [Armatimonadota bacterium]